MKHLTLPSLRWSVSSTDRKVCTRFCLHRVHRCIQRTPAACLSTLDTQPCLFSVGIPQLTGKVNLKIYKELKAAILTLFLDERKWLLLSLHAIFRQKILKKIKRKYLKTSASVWMDACDLTFPLICIQVAQLVVNDPITVYHGISRTPPGFYLIHTQFIYEIKLRYTRPTNCRDLGGPPIVHRLSGILQTDSAALFKIGAKKKFKWGHRT